MRYYGHTHAILQMTLSFAAETVTVPVLQSREISYHNATPPPAKPHIEKQTVR